MENSNNNKVLIPVPGATRNSHKFQEQHITTSGFMRPNVIFASEVIPNRSIKHNMEAFTRLAPLPVPTFGRARVYARSFFVPFRTICPHFNEFISGTPVPAAGSYAVTSSVPYVSNKLLASAFLNSNYSYEVTQAVDTYDFQASYASGSTTALTKRVFTDKGAYLYKLFLSLGYQINFNTYDNSSMSLLPVFSYAKVLLDWYQPSSYAYNSLYQYFDNLFTNQDVDFHFANSAAVISFLGNLYDLSFCEYNRSYFTSAFDNPIGPNRSSYSPELVFSDITTVNHVGKVSNSGDLNGTTTPMVELSDSRFTQYLDDVLKSLTDYSRRHQLSGVRCLDRYLAEYGVSLSSEVLKRSLYLNSDSFEIQFGDVMSHSDTEGASLGSYAGKGIGYGVFKFHFDNSNEFGYYLVISSVIPDVGYFQGQDRQTLHLNIQDFWHGDFDALGTQPISMREVFVGTDANSTYNKSGFNGDSAISMNDAIFGYAPRYSEYKVAHDKVTGNYRLATRNLGLPSYYLLRNVPVDTQLPPIDNKHSYNFTVGTDAEQYNRIFYSEKGENFNFIFNSQVEYQDYAAPLYDTYEFEEGYKNIQVSVGGTTVN